MNNNIAKVFKQKTPAAEISAPSTSFSFGFDVTTATEQPSSSFSFGFDLSTNEETPCNDLRPQDEVVSKDMTIAESPKTKQESTKSKNVSSSPKENVPVVHLDVNEAQQQKLSNDSPSNHEIVTSTKNLQSKPSQISFASATKVSIPKHVVNTQPAVNKNEIELKKDSLPKLEKGICDSKKKSDIHSSAFNCDDSYKAAGEKSKVSLSTSKGNTTSNAGKKSSKTDLNASLNSKQNDAIGNISSIKISTNSSANPSSSLSRSNNQPSVEKVNTSVKNSDIIANKSVKESNSKSNNSNAQNKAKNNKASNANNNNNNKKKSNNKNSSDMDDDMAFLDSVIQSKQNEPQKVTNNKDSKKGNMFRFVSYKDNNISEEDKNKARFGQGKNLVALGPRKVRQSNWLNNLEVSDNMKSNQINNAQVTESTTISTNIKQETSSTFSFGFFSDENIGNNNSVQTNNNDKKKKKKKKKKVSNSNNDLEDNVDDENDDDIIESNEIAALLSASNQSTNLLGTMQTCDNLGNEAVFQSAVESLINDCNHISINDGTAIASGVMDDSNVTHTGINTDQKKKKKKAKKASDVSTTESTLSVSGQEVEENMSTVFGVHNIPKRFLKSEVKTKPKVAKSKESNNTSTMDSQHPVVTPSKLGFVSYKDTELTESARSKLKYGQGKNLVAIGPRKVRQPNWLATDGDEISGATTALGPAIPSDISNVNAQTTPNEVTDQGFHSSPFSFSFGFQFGSF